MKATELMFGNFIYNKDGKVEKVYMLYRDGINGYTGEGGIIPDDEELFKPIPLTEQWLKDLGFKRARLVNIYYNKRFDVSFLLNYTPLCVPEETPKTEANWFDKEIKCKYVHQLQNLCFTLTGKKLIKK